MVGLPESPLIAGETPALRRQEQGGLWAPLMGPANRGILPDSSMGWNAAASRSLL